MFRKFALAAALSIAPALSAAAQSPAHGPAASDSSQCATLHTMLLQHASSLGLDSAKLDTIHAAMRVAVASGASTDSVHHALIAALMTGSANHAGLMQHMQQMSIDSTHIAAIHSCLRR